MMAIGVDNIITDRVPLAKRTLKHKDSNAVSDMVNIYLNSKKIINTMEIEKRMCYNRNYEYYFLRNRN